MPRDTVTSIPYGALSEALEPLMPRLRAPGALPDVQQLTELARILPEILHGRTELARPGPVAPETERLRLLQALRSALRILPRPVVAAVEDAQLGDDASLHLLLESAMSAAAPPMLLLATRTGADIPPVLDQARAALQRAGLLQRLRPAPLSADEVRRLAQHLGGPEGEDLVSDVYRESRGNPLLASRMLASLAEGKALSRAAADAHRDLGDRLPGLPGRGRP